MSYQVNCWIVFEKRHVSYVSLIRELGRDGWSLSDGHSIRYLVSDEKKLGTIQRVDTASEESVFKCFEEAEQAGEFIGMDLYWPEGMYNIWIGFNDWDDMKVTGRDHMKFLCYGSRKWLGNEFSGYSIDRAWYEARIVPTLEREGCVIESIEWFEGRG
jgi:hypothetical protein